MSAQVASHNGSSFVSTLRNQTDVGCQTAQTQVRSETRARHTNIRQSTCHMIARVPMHSFLTRLPPVGRSNCSFHAVAGNQNKKPPTRHSAVLTQELSVSKSSFRRPRPWLQHRTKDVAFNLFSLSYDDRSILIRVNEDKTSPIQSETCACIRKRPPQQSPGTSATRLVKRASQSCCIGSSYLPGSEDLLTPASSLGNPSKGLSNLLCRGPPHAILALRS